jgi:hypothetical protein
VPVLLERLRRKNPPFLRDELLLALAGVLGMGDWFYSTYSEFLEKGSVGLSLLRDRAVEPETSRIPRSLLEEMLGRFPVADKAVFASLAAELLMHLPVEVSGVTLAPTLADAIVDPRLTRLERFCFLVAAAIVWFAGPA